MARTINEIIEQQNIAQQRMQQLYTVITDEVSSDADLSGLTSISKTAEFSLWKYIWAAVAYIQESLWAESKAEIQQVVDDGITGTDRWFQKELQKFQYGDTLSWDDSLARYFYATIDPTKQIIKRCAVVSNGGLTAVKVAKEDGSGNPVALTGPELTAFLSYMRQIQWAGANIASPTSSNSDKLNAPMTVYYNGTIKLDDLKVLVQTAFDGYLKQLAFNGEYKITAHQDAIQNVAGINDVVIGAVEAKPDGGAYAVVNRIYLPASGYMERDGTIDFDVMITYVAQ